MSVTPGVPSGPVVGTSAQLLAAINELNSAQAAAQRALKAGDLAAYARAEQRVAAAIKAINQASGKQASPAATSTPTTASTSTPTPGPSP